MPGCGCFGPSAGPAEITLSLDEFEAVRLADFEGLYQEQAAGRMNVSRQTFGRIIETARRKIAQALVEGKTLTIVGGPVEMRSFTCSDCQHSWEVAFGTGRPQECPQCKSKNIHRSPQQRGGGREFGRGQNRRRCCRARAGRAAQ